jgi:propanol-preferring alcohol dehydrogenase
MIGTFQHYVLAPARYATPIPDGIPDDIAAVMMCSGATAYRSVKSSGLTPGSWVAILGGGGGVGVQVIQIARIFGLRPIVVDSGDSKCEISMRMGAEAFVDFGKFEDPAAEVVRISDGGANGVFVTAPAAYSMALRCIGSSIGSIIMCIGMSAMMSGHSIEASPNLLILKNITIKGTLAGTMDDTGAVLKFAQRGLIKQASRIISLEELPKTIEELKKGEVVGKLVVDFNR